MANDPNSTNFANNGAIVMTLLSAAGLVFSHFAPLEDTRPSSKEPQIHENLKVQDVEARLRPGPVHCRGQRWGEAKAAFRMLRARPGSALQKHIAAVGTVLAADRLARRNHSGDGLRRTLPGGGRKPPPDEICACVRA